MGRGKRCGANRFLLELSKEIGDSLKALNRPDSEEFKQLEEAFNLRTPKQAKTPMSLGD